MTLLHQSKHGRRRVLQHKIELCLMALGELRIQWPFAGWMYNLFRNLVERSRVEDSILDSSLAPCSHSAIIRSAAQPTTFDLSADIVARNSGQTSIVNEARADMISSGEFQTSACSEAQPISEVPSFENVVDPFASLRWFDWMSQNIDLEPAA